ncbi:hypothetical protein, partial [Stenotrophomonas sp. 3diitr2024]|uniref:hypothetical protein n=1 Tax=Stenotrophomonas sp. 3diitr2024 TaxID=3345115 RepID=UPI0035CC6865
MTADEIAQQVQLLDARNPAADGADDHADLAPLLEHVDAEAPGIMPLICAFTSRSTPRVCSSSSTCMVSASRTTLGSRP